SRASARCAFDMFLFSFLFRAIFTLSGSVLSRRAAPAPSPQWAGSSRQLVRARIGPDSVLLRLGQQSQRRPAPAARAPNVLAAGAVGDPLGLPLHGTAALARRLPRGRQAFLTRRVGVIGNLQPTTP